MMNIYSKKINHRGNKLAINSIKVHISLKSKTEITNIMKKFAHVFMLGLAVVLITASCGNETKNTSFEIKDPSGVRAGALVETNQEKALQLNFQGQMISINTDEIISLAEKGSAESQDAIDVMNINQSLMGAEKESQLLDVNFTMADEPVENGMFIFGIQTEDSKNLTLEVYDEEGFGMVANNKFEINEGNNYKALNVQTLDNGSYNFRLKDESGRELNRTIEVAASK